MSSTSTTWTTDTNTKSGTVQVYSSNVSVLKVVGDEGGNAVLDLFADQGDDNADKWRLWVNASDDDLHFSNYTSGTAWTDILTLQDGGNVGIGNATPGNELEVSAESAEPTIEISCWSGTDGHEGKLLFLKSSGALNVLDQTEDDENLGSIEAWGVNSSDDAEMACRVLFEQDAAADADSVSGRIKFMTSASDSTGADGSIPTAMTIDSAQNVGIGVIDPDSTLEILDTTTQLKLSYDATNYASFSVEADGLLNIVTVDPDGAEADICLNPDGYVGIGTTNPLDPLHVEGKADTVAAIVIGVDGTHATSDYPALRLLRNKDAGLVAAGDSLGALQFFGYLGSNANYYTNYELGASIEVFAAGSPSDLDNDLAAVMTFKTTPDGGTADTERMRIDEDGYIGIGNTSPAALLDIQRQATTGAVPLEVLRLAVKDVSNDQDLVAGEGPSIDFYVAESATTEYAGRLAVVREHAIDATADAAMTFYTSADDASPSEKMRINSAGRVGIGTTIPETSLHVQDGNITIMTNVADDASFNSLQFKRSKNATDGNSSTVADANCLLGAIDFMGADGDSFEKGAMIQAQVDETWSSTARGTYMTFHTVDNTTTTLDERMRIDHNGHVGIGATNPTSLLHVADTGEVSSALVSATLADTETVKLMVQGDGNNVQAKAEIGVYYATAMETDAPTGYIRLESSDGGPAYIWNEDNDDLRVSNSKTNIGKAAGTVIGTQTSDERLKNISSNAFPYGLAEVNQLTPIQYSFKNKVTPVNKLGFGAQTVRSIIPESVFDTKECVDGYDYTEDESGKEIATPKSSDTDTKLGMEYVQIIPVLVKAIQELSAKVTALESA